VLSKPQSHLLETIKNRIALDQKFKIVFYGDSTTSTEWVVPNWRTIFEYVLKMELENFEPVPMGEGLWNYSWWNLNFINAGLNGAMSADFLARLERDVFTYAPDMVIFMTGGNDVDKIPKEKHAEQLKRVLQLMGNKIPYVHALSDVYTANAKYNEGYSNYCREFKKHLPLENVTYIDLFEQTKNMPLLETYTFAVEKTAESFLTDPVFGNGKIDTLHANSLGNAYVAKYLLQAIFGISFNPELYIQGVEAGLKYPQY
jgi:lysophospholipase L1-like esterase